ncbi:MAG TPA: hypothetical protein VI932_02410, partial [Bacteroidota bacterium]|nr:hypothetical protein [Bacteroidota bacterium]
MLKRYHLFVIVAMLILPIACEEPDTCGPFPSKYDVRGYQIYFSTPGYFTGLYLDTTGSYSYQGISIRLLTDVDYLYSQNTHGTFSLYACSPLIPYSIDSISSITVTSVYDYNATHLSGDTLNDILSIQYIDVPYREVNIPLAAIDTLRPGASKDAFIRIGENPSDSSKQRFIVQITHTNGESFFGQTQVITILPDSTRNSNKSLKLTPNRGRST